MAALCHFLPWRVSSSSPLCLSCFLLSFGAWRISPFPDPRPFPTCLVRPGGGTASSEASVDSGTTVECRGLGCWEVRAALRAKRQEGFWKETERERRREERASYSTMTVTADCPL